jgi:hypothetical protein
MRNLIDFSTTATTGMYRHDQPGRCVGASAAGTEARIDASVVANETTPRRTGLAGAAHDIRKVTWVAPDLFTLIDPTLAGES